MPGCCGCFITTLARSSTPLTVCTQAVVPAAALVWTPDSLHFYDSSVEGGLVHARSCPIAVPLQSCVPLPSSRYFTLDIHGTCSVWEVAGSGVPHLLQSCALAPADSSSHAWLPTGVVTSGVQDGRLCVCCFTNTVHVIHTTSHEGLRVLTASAVPCFGPLSAPSAGAAPGLPRISPVISTARQGSSHCQPQCRSVGVRHSSRVLLAAAIMYWGSAM